LLISPFLEYQNVEDYLLSVQVWVVVYIVLSCFFPSGHQDTVSAVSWTHRTSWGHWWVGTAFGGIIWSVILRWFV